MKKLWWALLAVILAAAFSWFNRGDEGWQLTGTFAVPAVTGDGRHVEQILTGVEDKYGFIGLPFVAGENQKYLWHFWGQSQDFVGKQLEVTGVKRGGQTVPVFQGQLFGPVNTAVAGTPSMMSLPSPGVWRLEIRVDGEHLGDIVVEAVRG